MSANVKTIQKSLPKVAKKEIVIVTREERQKKIQKLMSKHVGQENGVSQYNVFKTVYGKPDNYKPEVAFILWRNIKLDMNWLRRTTHCFIGSKPHNGTYYYFLVQDWNDAELYINIMKRNIKRCKYMIERCKKAVEEEFYKDVN